MIQPITCHEIIESYDKEIKNISTNFNEKRNLYNPRFLYFTCIFINYYSILISVCIYCYCLIKYRPK